MRELKKELPVIMMSGHGTIDTAVKATQLGARDFLEKPISRDRMLLALKNALEHQKVVEELQTLRAEVGRFDMVGQGAAMQRIYALIQRAAPSEGRVLITGENGSGKELVARAIHQHSKRKTGPFVKLNCAAVPHELIESELFGHEKGSFTGAVTARRGKFELADGGTLFLDEVGDMPAQMQAKLLRVLQEGELERVGGTDTIKVDVRVIAATNVDLAKAKEAGKFREDLFYRLNVITVQLPPLRDRPEDIPLLAQHFLKIYATKVGKKVTSITPAAMEALTTARWVGNVRELENCMERAVVLCAGEQVELEELPPEIRNSQRSGADIEVFSLAHLPYAQAKKLAMRAFERRYLSALLDRSSNNVSMAARAAGVDRSNFRRLLKQYEVGGRSMKPTGAANDVEDAADFDEAAS